MAAPELPSVVCVVGCTGSGKTKLGVELALALGGEVISADALQVYDALPIATNRATEEEMRGVPHHLLACHDPLAATPFSVLDFRDRADMLISEIRGRGRVPVIVGGTHYYVYSLLWRSLLLDSATSSSASSASSSSNSADSTSFGGPNEAESEGDDHDDDEAIPTNRLYARLQAIDPAMAARLHQSDRRKIARSLQVFDHYGQPYSDLLAEQATLRQQAKGASSSSSSDSPSGATQALRYRALLCFLWADAEVLDARLDARVDQMLARGLVAELQAFRARVVEAGPKVAQETQQGIFQAIGYKEFFPLFVSPQGDAAAMRDSIDKLKQRTRRYSRTQMSWMRNKVIPATRREPRDQCRVLTLNATNVAAFDARVVQPALAEARAFLAREPIADAPADPHLPDWTLSKPLSKPTRSEEGLVVRRTCDICDRTVMGIKEWHEHLHSRQHKRSKGVRKRAQLDASANNKNE